MPPYGPFAEAPFDHDHLIAMFSAYEIVSRDFGLEVQDATLRKWVQSAVLECAHRGVRDRIQLRKCATQILRLPSWQRPN
jgi:hypothetical protein